MSGGQIIERMMFGFIESQTLFVCHRLKVFDHLGEHGAARCEEIAASLRLPADSLERLLISATSTGLLEKQDGRYRVPALLAPYLVATSERYVGGRFSHYANVSYGMFAHLEQAVREDRPQWHHGRDTGQVQNVYTDLVYADADATRDFLETMWSSGFTDSLDLCERISFEGYQRLVDLGGATGSFAIAALLKNPRLSAVVMDLPPVEQAAIRTFAAHGCSDRASFHRGDMFEDPLPAGDLYVIGYVLSDWPEEQCLALIRKAHAALPPGGRIVILEKLFDADKTGPFLTAMLNVTMLVEMTGKHRSGDEYRRWLEDAGFGNVSTVHSAGEKHMVTGTRS
jgi:hypothetical protein